MERQGTPNLARGACLASAVRSDEGPYARQDIVHSATLLVGDEPSHALLASPAARTMSGLRQTKDPDNGQRAIFALAREIE
jgi:hypothetical protein